MPKENQEGTNKQQAQSKRESSIEAAVEQIQDQDALPELATGLMGAAGDGSIQAQAGRLSDTRFSRAQRQAVAAQIGQMGGNQYLQRVIAQIDQHGQRKSDVEQSVNRFELGVSLIPEAIMSKSGPASAIVQREDDGADTALLNGLLSATEGYAGDFENLHTLINDYSTASRDIGDSIKDVLIEQAGKYDEAYERFSGVVGAGRADAQNQEFWVNIGMGVVAGVVVGLLAAWALPTAAAGAWALAMGEIASVAGSAAGQAIAGGLIAGGLSSAVGPAGTDLEPGGLRPEVVRMRLWQNAAQIYRDGLTYSEYADTVHQASVLAQAAIGEIRVHLAEGETRVSIEELDHMVQVLNSANGGLAPVAPEVNGKLATLVNLQSATQNLSATTSEEMERDIWVLWISGLEDPSVLDLDEIEDYLHAIGILGPGSVLGVDFGGWTLEADENAAHDSARELAGPIQNRINTLGAPGGAEGAGGAEEAGGAGGAGGSEGAGGAGVGGGTGGSGGA